MHPTFKLSVYASILSLAFSCDKISILDKLPDDKLAIPTTLGDCQRLLDDDRVMNGYGFSGYPVLPEVGSDDYYLTDGEFDSLPPIQQQASTWAREINMGNTCPDWDLPYRVVRTANAIFKALDTISATNNMTDRNNIMGAAFFFRGFAYYHLAQEFAAIYDSATAGSDPGIPLRQTADINEALHRSTVQQTYDQIIGDLRQAGALLSNDTSHWTTRPSKAAVYGMLSRVFLSAGNYSMAGLYADSCLQLKKSLMLFDTVSGTSMFPFDRWNVEVIFSAAYFNAGAAATMRSHVDITLFHSYQTNDLRKTLFFKYGDFFFGRYDQEGYCFAGISVGEMLLTRSECYARADNAAAAMTLLNNFLQTRWTAGTFTPLFPANADDALQLILLERRKELLFRGTRWVDLRRLSKDHRTAQTLSRTIHGVTYTLHPGDARYTLPIPDYVLNFNPGMKQNKR